MQKGGICSHEKSIEGETNDWLTPPDILEALGEFDLDPCSTLNRPWDTALKHYTILDDGLALPWHGRVFMNPPYGPMITWWLKKLSEHGNGIALIFARTETEAFHEHIWKTANGIFFFEGRLSFRKPDGKLGKTNAGAPSCLVAYGENNCEALKNCGFGGKYLDLDPIIVDNRQQSLF